MSIFSKLLKKTVGIPEVNINKLPFANKIVGDWESKSMEDLVKQLPKEMIAELVDAGYTIGSAKEIHKIKLNTTWELIPSH